MMIFMVGKELFKAMSEGKMPERIPFVPVIYEHAAKVIGKSISELCQSADLLVEAQLRSYELYKNDLISVGVDIYNVEYEAMGAKFDYTDKDSLPATSDILVKCKENLKGLKVPDPQKDGRMPMFLDAAERINKEVGSEVGVSGTIMGPFTLAAIARGFENIIMDMIDDPEFVEEQLEFALEVVLEYGKAFIDRGVGVAINESWIAPPLLSPSFYKKYAVKYEKRLISELKEYGAASVALISGGRTTPIISDMASTGTSLLMCDYSNDRKLFKKFCIEHDIILRASIESKIVSNGSDEDIYKETKAVIDDCADYNKFVMGCGVVGYDTKPDRLIRFREIVRELDPRKH
jgi:uroporphyrinogen decarboxylase